MSKILTVKIDDDVYEMLMKAARSKKKNIARFIESLAIEHTSLQMHVSNDEMSEYLLDKKLLSSKYIA